ncbi:MAG: hypothetical protein GY862_07830, partial [Gammaproteobacteria bacterium]|nr:hypothetical protein [Gammaproteobacteria bacterium]
NNLKRGETYNTPRGTRGPVFYSDVPCFGSIVVEYEAGYTEYQVLYDFPEPKRVFDITAGNIQKTGFITKDVGGEIVEWDTDLREESGIGGLLDQEIEVEGKNNIVQPIVRHVKLSDGTNMNPNTGAVIPKGEPLIDADGLVDVNYDTEPCDYYKEDDNPPCRKVALRLFFRLNFKPFRVTPLTLVATNGRQCNTATFTPPEPNFSDASQDELPKVAVYESRIREMFYPEGGGSEQFSEVDVIDEIHFVNIHGNITTEKIQRSS